MEEVARDKRFAKMRSTQTFAPPSRHAPPVSSPTPVAEKITSANGNAKVAATAVRSVESVAQPLPPSVATRKTTAAIAPKSVELITVALRRTTKTGVKSASLKLTKRTSLRDALAQLLAQSGSENEVLDAGLVEVMFPLPRRRLSKASAELDRFVVTWALDSNPSNVMLPVYHFNALLQTAGGPDWRRWRCDQLGLSPVHRQ